MSPDRRARAHGREAIGSAADSVPPDAAEDPDPVNGTSAPVFGWPSDSWASGGTACTGDHGRGPRNPHRTRAPSCRALVPHAAAPRRRCGRRHAPLGKQWFLGGRQRARGVVATSGSSHYTQAGASDQTTAGRSRTTSNRSRSAPTRKILALSVDRKLLGTSTSGPHQARPAPAVVPHDPPHSANACRSAIGRPIRCGMEPLQQRLPHGRKPAPKVVLSEHFDRF